MVMQIMNEIQEEDELVGKFIKAEYDRQQKNIELIASENIVSPTVMLTMATCLTNKYAEGYPRHRYYGGCQEIDNIEELAKERACRLFGAEHANVQPHSGSSANLAVYSAFLKPGDTVLSMSLENGGHLTHGSSANASGKLYRFVHYGVDKNGYIDFDDLTEKLILYHPKMVVAGASAYPRTIDFEEFARRINNIKIKEVGADEWTRPIFMVDMAHIAGLVATGLHKSPIPYADVVTSTTHKTLRGPRGGLILCKSEYAKKIDSAIFPANQGGPLEHIIAAKAVCFGEGFSNSFKTYQEQVLKNAKVLAKALKDNGFKLVTDGTDNHLILIDLRNKGITGKEFESRLDEVRITVNKNTVPNETERPTITSGVRIGTPAVTTRGFKEEEMKKIADWMRRVCNDWPYCKDKVLSEVIELTNKYPLPYL